MALKPRVLTWECYLVGVGRRRGRTPPDASELCPYHPSSPPPPLEILGRCLSLGVSARSGFTQVIQAHKNPSLAENHGTPQPLALLQAPQGTLDSPLAFTWQCDCIPIQAQGNPSPEGLSPLLLPLPAAGCLWPAPGFSRIHRGTSACWHTTRLWGGGQVDDLITRHKTLFQRVSFV